MIRANWVPRGLLAVALLLPMACTNNPFNPRAELVVTAVTAPATPNQNFVNVIGIAQVVDKLPASSMSYLYQDPAVTIRSGTLQPEAYIDSAVAKITIGGTPLPSKRIPVIITVPKGGQVTAPIPILRGDSDVRNAVFPDDSPSLGTEGVAEVTLLGKDKNGNEVSVAFTAPLAFTTLVGSSALTSPPTPSPSPSPAASASPGAAPTPNPSPSH